MIKSIKKYSFFVLITFFILFVLSCKTSENQKNESELLTIDIDTNSVLVRFKNNLFSLPSPHQASLIIKKNNIPFNKELLNSEENYSRYTTTIKKALNMGVYSTDLGYLNMYEKPQDALTCFLIIEKIAGELELASAMNSNVVESLEKNLGNNDSILRIVSKTFRDIDSYLTINNREAVGVLIVTGGWIESMYLTTQLLLESNNAELVKFIGKQKYPLDKLIKLLAPYYDQSKEFSEMIDMFTDLAYEFDCIDIEYYYIKPTTYPDKKLTIINSKSKLLLNNYKLSKLASKIAVIRNKIIN